LYLKTTTKRRQKLAKKVGKKKNKEKKYNKKNWCHGVAYIQNKRRKIDAHPQKGMNRNHPNSLAS
jgi:hypothetical protein